MGNSIALHCSVCRLLAKIIHQSHKTEMLPFLRLSLAACPSQHHQQHHKTAGCAGADMRAGKRWGRGAGSGSAACWGPDRHLCCEPACRAKQPPGELLSPTRLPTHECSHAVSRCFGGCSGCQHGVGAVVAVAVVVVVAVVVRPMLETSSLNARCWCRVQVMRRLGVEPTERKFLVLKSRVHWYSTPS